MAERPHLQLAPPPKKNHCDPERVSEAFNYAMPALKRMLGRLLPSSFDQEDLLQEAYLRGLQAAHNQEIDSLVDYLFVITRNLALRAKKRESQLLETFLPLHELSEEASPEPAPLTRTHSLLRLEAFLAATENLPEQCQKAFLLKYVFGCSQKEVASLMGIAQSTVEKHLSKGFKRCKSELAAKEYLELEDEAP